MNTSNVTKSGGAIVVLFYCALCMARPCTGPGIEGVWRNFESIERTNKDAKGMPANGYCHWLERHSSIVQLQSGKNGLVGSMTEKVEYARGTWHGHRDSKYDTDQGHIWGGGNYYKARECDSQVIESFIQDVSLDNSVMATEITESTVPEQLGVKNSLSCVLNGQGDEMVLRKGGMIRVFDKTK